MLPKKQILKFSKQQQMHVARPPRLEGKVKNAMMFSSRKKKKS